MNNLDGLRHLLNIEGKAGDWREAMSMIQAVDGLLVWVVDMGLLTYLELVVGVYKSGAVCRHLVDGVNERTESLSLFESFSGALAALAADKNRPVITRALMTHSAGSGMASVNGNEPTAQESFNRQALRILAEVPDEECDDAWSVVADKIAVALFENGFDDFDEAAYTAIVVRMRKLQLKDAAGRGERLARWLIEQGRAEEAKTVLEETLSDDTWSAPNQRQRANALYLEHFGAEEL